MAILNRTEDRRQSRGSRTRRSDGASLTQLREQAAVVGRDVQRLAATAGQTAIHQMDPLEEYIRDKPMQAVLIAAGIGALMSLVFFRR